MRRGSEDGWFAGALLVIAVVSVVDVLDQNSSLAGAVAVAPLVAATLCSPRRTAVVSVITVMVGVWLLLIQADPTPATIAARGGVILLGVVLGPVVAARRARRERRLGDLARVAEAAQLAVLTPIPPAAGPTRLASLYQSASREALIGGDLYGVAETPEGVRLMIGDVRGKGIDAVRVAAVILSAFREGTQGRSTLGELAQHCDQRLRPSLVPEDFVTALFTDIAYDGTMRLVSCGHPGPIHARAGELEEVEIPHPGTPLGLPHDMVVGPEPHEIRLRADDRLLFYTDGLMEARTPSGGFVPMTHAVAHISTAKFEDALAGVLAQLHTVTGESHDDMALVLVEYSGQRRRAAPGQDETPRVSTTPAASLCGDIELPASPG
jgi:phosphoserine phosphatase RsbU/P